MYLYIEQLANRILTGYRITEDEAWHLATTNDSDLVFLFAWASKIREHYFGSDISLCSIINAKSGLCTEDCAFCAQSSHHRTDAPVFPLVDTESIIATASKSAGYGSECFGIITSGSGISVGEELDRICATVRQIAVDGQINPSCSLGCINEETALLLKDAGVVTYHHNLETAESFFSNICTTHDYEDDVETIRAVKRSGMKVCSGGIFGLGENMSQRIELAVLLRGLDVDSIPINFLDPVQGTALQHADFLTPLECLKIIAIYRFILPDRKITVCGGREHNLRELQSWIFAAGASGMMTGDYLTKKGRSPETDRQLLTDLRLHPTVCYS